MYCIILQAWSTIVFKLVPNVQELDRCLRHFGDLIECNEVMIFERTTLLVVSSYTRVAHNDSRRFEKISNIMKKFKFSCRLVFLFIYST